MPGTVTITGTVQVPQVVGQYVGGSGVTFLNSGGLAFDSAASIQRGLNLFDETQQYIAQLTAAVNTSLAALTPPQPPIPPLAVVDQLMLILAAIRRQPTMTAGNRLVNP